MAIKPYVIKPIPSKVIRQKRVFKLALGKYFAPKDESLSFALLGHVPKWLFIDGRTGILSGVAPIVTHTVQVLVTVEAKNTEGGVSQSFHLKIVNTEFFDAITESLINTLTPRNRLYRFNHLDELPRRHDLLEYIFEFLMKDENQKQFLNSLKEKAAKLNIKTEKNPNYTDFVAVVTAVNPGYEKLLEQQISEKHLARMAEISRIELRNAFRQGSQPTGSIVPEVLNEIGIVDYVNISDNHAGFGKTILDAAADGLIELRHLNELSNVKKNFHP